MKITTIKPYNARRLYTDFFIDCNSDKLQWIAALLQGASATISPVDITSKTADTNDTFSCSWWSINKQLYSQISENTKQDNFVGNKILLSPSRPMPLRSAQNPHNCWVFETIYHSSCVLFDRPLHSKSCIKIVVVCRHIFLWKSVSAPKCQKLDKFSMKRTGTL